MKETARSAFRTKLLKIEEFIGIERGQQDKLGFENPDRSGEAKHLSCVIFSRQPFGT